MKQAAFSVALLLLVFGLAQTPQGRGALSDMGLFERPASYTELSFAAPGRLPSTLRAPDSPLQVSFIINNARGARTSYHWSVALGPAGKARVRASGTADVPLGGRAAVTRSVRAACKPGARLEVLAELAAPAESIDFWVTCKQAR